jgi:hypothetical protein
MRALLLTFLLAAVSLPVLFNAPSRAVDCATVRSSCVEQCARGVTSASRLQACVNRCSVASCTDVPSVCRPGDQNVCQDDFRSCTGSCEALAALPSAAATQTIELCARRCCNNLRLCLNQRQCNTTGFSCR